MATAYWIGNAKPVAAKHVFTVTAAAVSGTLTATINGKAEQYTCTTTTAATEAAAFVAALNASLVRELSQFTFSSSGAVITAVGPADGRPVSISWAAAGGTTISAVTSTTGAGPHDINNTANWSTGAVPGNGDTAVFENNTISALYNLATWASNTVTVIKRKSYGGNIGLPDTNALGFPEYLAKFLETAGTGTHVIEDNGVGCRLRTTSASAVTVVVTGAGGGTLNSETVEVYGSSHTSSVLRVNGAAVAVAPADSQSAAFGTLTVANGVIRTGTNGTFTNGTITNSQAEVGGNYTTLLIDRGSTVTVTKAATAATSTTVEDGTLNWASTGGWNALTIASGATVDATLAPSSISTGTITLSEGGSLLDPNERIAKTYTINLTGEMANVTLDLGTTVSLAVS